MKRITASTPIRLLACALALAACAAASLVSAPASAFGAPLVPLADDELSIEVDGAPATDIVFNLYPGYETAPAIALTITNTSDHNVRDIHFDSFTAHEAVDLEGNATAVPYTRCSDEGSTTGYVDFTKAGYARQTIGNLARGRSLTVYLTVAEDAFHPSLAEGTDVADTVLLASTTGTTALSLRTRVYEPEGVTAQVGIFELGELGETPGFRPKDAIVVPDVESGSTQAIAFSFMNTSSTIDPHRGAYPSIYLADARIEDDDHAIFGFRARGIDDPLYFPGSSIEAGDAYPLGVTANARYAPAGTYTATLVLYVSPRSVTLGDGIAVEHDPSWQYARVRVPVSVTVTGESATVLPAPTSLAAEAGDGRVYLSWDAMPGNPNGYLVWREAPGVARQLVEEFCNDPHYLDANVENGVTYTYYVAQKHVGATAYSTNNVKAGPVSATPNAGLANRLDAPEWHWSGEFYGTQTAVDAIELCFSQPGAGDGAGVVDHFNVYLDGVLSGTVPQDAVQERDYGNDVVVHYWCGSVGVAVPYVNRRVTVTAVSPAGAEGLPSAVQYCAAASATPRVTTTGAFWDHAERCVEVEATVEGAPGDELVVHVTRNGAEVGTVAAGETFLDRGVAAGRTYTYQVWAAGFAGTPSERAQVSVSTPADDDAGSIDTSIEHLRLDEGDLGTVRGTLYAATYWHEEATVQLLCDGKVVSAYPGTQTADGAVHFSHRPGAGIHAFESVVRLDGQTVARSGAQRIEVPEGGFSDVPAGAYYEQAVEWAADAGVTTGYDDNTFRPLIDCSRAQVVTFLWRAAGEPTVTSPMPFADVKPSAYYYEAVRWAYATGVTTGINDTTFNPTGTCTRGQFVTFLWRNEGKPAPASRANPFADVAGTAYYHDAVLWAYHATPQITTGTSATKFSPARNVSRAQVVTFLYRAQ